MATPTTTIDALPLQTVVTGTQLVIIQETGVTKKSPVDAIVEYVEGNIVVTVSADEVSALLNPNIIGATVQSQLTDLISKVEDVETAIAIKDVVWVGPEAPTDPVVEMWWDPDEPSAYLPVGVEYATEAETIEGTIANKAVSPAGDAAALAAHDRAPKVDYFDVWNAALFDGGLNMYVTGQNVANRFTTAVAATGATVISLDSVVGVTAGVCLLTNYGTANQQVHRVVSVVGNDVTVARPIVTALTNGQLLASLWTNASHLSSDAGFQAFAYEIAYAKRADGSYMIEGTAPKVTYLGNSWFALGDTRYADKLHLRIPGAVVVNAGVGGNTSAMMLARFDTDVPADSDYVVLNEPGVNDVYQSVTAATQASNLERLVAKIEAIGAKPIIVGPVPLIDLLTSATTQHNLINLQIGDGSTFPAIRMSAAYGAIGNADLITVPNVSSIGIGGREAGGTLDSATGAGNTALGSLAAADMTTGFSNVVVGRQAGWKTATGSLNTVVGTGAHASNVAGAGNTVVGQQAGFAALSNSNVFVGKDAGYAPNNTPANATTTGAGQTVVGYQAGQGGAAVASFITCLGSKAIASASGGVAIGTDSGGVGAAAVAANEIALGTALHNVLIRGKVGFNGAAPVAKAANPGVAAGTDAAVLNAVITALRNLGLVT
jgi:hypothetical protein